MSNNYGVVRYGYEESARIAGTTGFGTLGAEVLVGEPSYPPIPFMPSITTGTGAQVGGGSSSEHDTWQRYPSRCDLIFYQGDDVLVDLYIQDPNDASPDMSTDWEWSAQIRVIHSYHSTLLNTFSVIDEYIPPVDETPGQTKVTLFLPRTENVFVGKYRWDLYSTSPLDVANFPRPPDVPEPEPWPPTDQIRTWLYGAIKILPRVSSTDILYEEIDSGESAGGGGVQTIAFFSGPNGRVP